MTQNTQTTAERIRDIIEDHIDAIKAAQKIAAEIDALTRERDEARAELLKEREAYSKRAAEQTVSGASKLMIAELAEARAEVERLRPAAEAWDAQRFFSDLMDMDASDPTADGYRHVTDDEIIAASIACQKADAAARAAKGAA